MAGPKAYERGSALSVRQFQVEAVPDLPNTFLCTGSVRSATAAGVDYEVGLVVSVSDKTCTYQGPGVRVNGVLRPCTCPAADLPTPCKHCVALLRAVATDVRTDREQLSAAVHVDIGAELRKQRLEHFRSFRNADPTSANERRRLRTVIASLKPHHREGLLDTILCNRDGVKLLSALLPTALFPSATEV